VRRSPVRRFCLALGAIALVACYVTRVSDEDRVAEYASKQMDCDPALIHLESESASSDQIARYTAHGCGQSRTFDCTQEGDAVVCRPMARTPTSESDGNNTAGSVVAGVILASACACAHAGSGSSSRSSSSPRSTPSPNPGDPVRGH
jgi:hypothetical protein